VAAVDLDDLLELVGGDRALVRELSALFCEDAPGRVAASGAAIRAGDATALFESAHALKGAAAALGAQQVRAVALELETHGRKQSLAGTEQPLARLKVARDQALHSLARLLPDAAQR
jgi:HPt (histidine-containing phosphotransfer) domain-containing protein